MTTTRRPAPRPRPHDEAPFASPFYFLGNLTDMRHRGARRHLARAQSWRLYETYFPTTFRRLMAAEQLTLAGRNRRALLRACRLAGTGVTHVTPAYAAAFGLK